MFPLDFHFTQEELKEDVLSKTNACDAILPWIKCFIKQLERKDAEYLTELLSKKTGRSYS
jgi:hypothetical protein